MGTLFQVPKRSVQFGDDVWFEATALGPNTLGGMMAVISEQAQLSQRYTNHCLRATAITIFDDAGYASRHIMTFSGHKAETSLKSYSHHKSERMKRAMSQTLSKSVGLPSTAVVPFEPPQPAAVGQPQHSSVGPSLPPDQPLSLSPPQPSVPASPLLTNSQENTLVKDLIGDPLDWDDDCTEWAASYADTSSSTPGHKMAQQAVSSTHKNMFQNINAQAIAPNITNSTVNIHYHFH